MGANDGHPHPNQKGPPIPCGGLPFCNVPGKPHTQNRPDAVPKPALVESSGYVIVGKFLLAASGAFAGILLALVALHLYNSGRRRHFRGRRRLLRSLAISGAGDERDGGASPSPRGLDPAVLCALPVVAAGAGAGDCAVCLAEFEHGEKVRALPRCGHRFHVECIDTWFRGNSTCPLCRADVEAPAATEAQPEVRIDVAGDAAPAAKVRAPAMGRLPSGTDLEKTRRIFASTRSASF